MPEHLSGSPKLNTGLVAAQVLALVAVATILLLQAWAGSHPGAESAVVVLRPAEQPGQAYVAIVGVGDGGSWVMAIDGPRTPGRRVPVTLTGACRCEPHQVRERLALRGWRLNLFVALCAVVVGRMVVAWRRRGAEQREVQASMEVANSGQTMPVRLRTSWFEPSGQDLLCLEVLAADEDRTIGWVDARLIAGRFDPAILVRMLGAGVVGAPVALACQDGCHWLLANGPLRATPFARRTVRQPHARSGDVNRLLGWEAPTAAPVLGSTTRVHVDDLPVANLDATLASELTRPLAVAGLRPGALVLLVVFVSFAVRSNWSADLFFLGTLVAWGVPVVAVRLVLRRRFHLLEQRLRATVSGVGGDAAWMVRALAFGVLVARP